MNTFDQQGWLRWPTRPLYIAIVLTAPFCGFDHASALDSAHCAVNRLAEPEKPLHFRAKVQGLAPAEEVQRETRIAESRTGASVSPEYVGLPRIMAVYTAAGVTHTTIAAVVDGHIPKPGDTVELASRRRDPKSPCHFIPWTVVASPTL